MNEPLLLVALGVGLVWFSAGWVVFDLWGNKPRTGLKRKLPQPVQQPDNHDRACR